jgi:hypothetical protein
VLCSPSAEEFEALTTLRTILGVGLERPLWFPLWYK